MRRIACSLVLLLIGCATTRSRTLPWPATDAARTYGPILSMAQREGFETRTFSDSIEVRLPEQTATVLRYRVNGPAYELVAMVDGDEVGNVEQQLQWALELGEALFERASRWFGVAPATGATVNITIKNEDAKSTASVDTPAPPPLPPPPQAALLPSKVQAPEEPDAWLGRNRGFSLGPMVGAGWVASLAAMLSYDLGRFSVVAAPGAQLRLGSGGGFTLFGGEAGVRFHLARRFSFGAGLAVFHVSYQAFGPKGPQLEAVLTPVLVRLGRHEQGWLGLSIPVRLVGVNDLPPLAAFVTFSWQFRLSGG